MAKKFPEQSEGLFNTKMKTKLVIKTGTILAANIILALAITLPSISQVTVLRDTTPPSAPAGLNVSVGDKTVELTWDTNTEQDLAGYNIYRKETSGTRVIRRTSNSTFVTKEKLNKSLSMVKVFFNKNQNINSLLKLDIAVYKNLSTYAIAEVSDEELDKLYNSGFDYKFLDTDSQAKRYYLVRAPTQEILENIYQYATVLDIQTNTAIIRTDVETALEIPQLGFQIRPIRRRPLKLREKKAIYYRLSSIGTSEQEFTSDIISNAGESSVTNYIQTLQDFDTRLSLTTGYDQSAEYAFGEFREMGLEVEYHQFIMYGQTKNNVVATLTGTTNPDEIFIICAHLDSTSNDPWNYAPGAEDNASGSAMVLEAARVLSRYFFDSTIKFILFGGEEQGGYGSDGYVEDLGGDIENIAGVINCDMIAYLDTPDNDISIVSHSSWQELANKIVNTANTYEAVDIEAYNVVNDNAWWSDHWVFWEYSRPAICAIEYEKSHFYPDYHTTSDTIDKIDTSFAEEVAKLSIASLSELANPIISLSSPPADYEKINDTPIITTDYIDTDVTNGTTYIYIFTSVDNTGNESIYFAKTPATPVNNLDSDPPAIPTDRLQAYWKLNESRGTRYDSSGNSNHLRPSSYAKMISGTGINNNAARFREKESNRSYLYISSQNQTNLYITGDLTISAWIKYKKIHTGSKFTIVKRGKNYRLFIRKKDKKLIFRNGNRKIVSATRLLRNTWYHIAVVREGNTVKIFINGELNKQRTRELYYGSIYRRLVIGYYGREHYSVGKIDELAIWNRALSNQEIRDLYETIR